ncbi:hypothetical protein A2859_01830 [Candidatus Roizmanbacteria bacterium RIFCSPHIGHO2_01_FULL_37_16b]|nr:MAG: hypothetical protein A2859_01830 [Candidatus Roizmanbacteria bacterium RIFCSPHIGHO2_01_FULL_37_16b]
MIIGPKKLLKLVKEIKLVEDLAERELTNPEGAGFDLRLGEVHEIFGDAFLGEEERNTPKIKTIAKHKKGKKQKITIKPNEFYLISTIEKINLPENITANFKPRTTTFRSGLFLRTGNAAPGYRGKLTFGLKNEGPVPVTLELGARVVHVQFHWVDGGGSMYRGQWQGGRVTTKKREKQI